MTHSFHLVLVTSVVASEVALVVALEVALVTISILALVAVHSSTLRSAMVAEVC